MRKWYDEEDEKGTSNRLQSVFVPQTSASFLNPVNRMIIQQEMRRISIQSYE